jgi:hypothetical protein
MIDDTITGTNFQKQTTTTIARIQYITGSTKIRLKTSLTSGFSQMGEND